MEYVSQGQSSAALNYLKAAELFLNKIPESRYPQLLAEFGGKDIRGEVDAFVASVDRQMKTPQISIVLSEQDGSGFSQQMDRGRMDMNLPIFSMLDSLFDPSKYRMSIDLDYGKTVRQSGELFNVYAMCNVILREDKTNNVVCQLSQASVGFGRDQQLAAIDAMDRCIDKSVKKMGLLLEGRGYAGM